MTSAREYIDTVRDILTVYPNATFIIQPNGAVLIYKDAPASGNLIMSHSEAGSGMDSFGNPYLEGDTSYV